MAGAPAYGNELTRAIAGLGIARCPDLTVVTGLSEIQALAQVIGPYGDLDRL
jgi:hypothetical protein